MDLTHAKVSARYAAVVHTGQHLLPETGQAGEVSSIQRLALDYRQLMKREVPIIPLRSGQGGGVVPLRGDVKKPARYPEPAVADLFPSG